MPKLDLPRNELLATLPREEYLRLLPSLEYVSLEQNEILYERDRPMRYAFFPEQGLISLLAILREGNSLEVAVIGKRGFLGVSLALGGRISTQLALVQVAGSAMRMKAEAFRAAFRHGGAFHKIVLKYTRYHLLTVSQSAICNYFHRLQTRLARLLLTVHDQVDSSEFPMTLQFMSRSLGTARSEVAKTAALFRRRGLIDYSHGKVKILDRKKLEAAACECYRAEQTTLPVRRATRNRTNGVG